MHDRNGKPLKVGDQVFVPAIVTQVHPGSDACNVTLQGTQPDDAEVGGGRPVIACNSRAVLLREVTENEAEPEAPETGPGNGEGLPQGQDESEAGRDENGNANS